MSQTTSNGRVYHQVHSTAVGSAVSIVVTNVVMRTSIRKHWQRFIPPHPTHPHISVGGWLMAHAVLPRVLVDSFHSQLNSISTNVQFTMKESQKDNFPDWVILLMREEDSVSTYIPRVYH